jgi:hypothetical protein
LYGTTGLGRLMRMTMIEIFDPDVGGGSGYGLSFYKAMSTGCPHAAKLYRESDIPRPPAGLAARVGIYYHKLQEVRALDKEPEEVFEVKDPDSDAAWGEALELFRRYKQVHPRNFWGTIVAAEVQLEHENIDKFFGAKVTGRLDLLTRLSKEDITRLSAFDGLETLALYGPGLYSVDYKSQQEQGGRDLEFFNASNQAALYQKAYELQTGETLKGFIIDGIARLKQRKRKTAKGERETAEEFEARFMRDAFFKQVVPPPSEEHIAGIRSQLQRDAARYDAGEKNFHCCWTSRYSPCTFIDTCERGF